ncbi:hypothetical protein [Nostoc sp.]|uniref:hypothetical protein n=1 Tax=Nostoc sp. TaxID=1180 RepID=UPI002FF568AA
MVTELVLSVAVGAASRREGRVVPLRGSKLRAASVCDTLRERREVQPLQELYWSLASDF